MALDPKEYIREKAGELGVKAAEKIFGRKDQPAAAPVPAGEPAFRSTLPWTKENKAGTLVIACSSSRFLPHTEEFLEEGLNLAEYDLLAVPGGIQWLALPDLLPKHNKVARWVTEYLIKKHDLARVVCIAHEDCSAYEDDSVLGSLAHLATGKSTTEHQIEQLLKVGRDIREEYQVKVDLFYASVANGVVVFRAVEEPAQKK
jgi:hypothetical protein